MDQQYFNQQRVIARIRIDTTKGVAKGYCKAKDFKSHKTFPPSFHTPSFKESMERKARAEISNTYKTGEREINPPHALANPLLLICQELGVGYLG